MLFASWRRVLNSCNKRCAKRWTRLALELLEDRLAPAGLITLASFPGAPNGLGPAGGLVEDSSGNLFGTASSGGADDDGTVFEVLAGSRTLITMASFNGTSPNGDLIEDSSGDLFGTSGGSEGTVFELKAGSSSITTLASFNNGAFPNAGLVEDSSGDLFGTTLGADYGGSGDGSVFEVQAGSGSITTLASLNGSNGEDPSAGVIEDSSGNLYGTAYDGGASHDGTVFELKAGSSTITTLASFNSTNGQNPDDQLVEDSKGNLFGTSYSYGSGSNSGTVFEVKAGSSSITTLATFNTNGWDPIAGLVEDSRGNLYGTTSDGDGTVFELKKGSSTITTLASFNGINGSFPSNLIEDSSGDLFGTAGDGPSGNGEVFEVMSGSSTITTLDTFNYAGGANPTGTLLEDSSGNLFGATPVGGAYQEGTVFELKAGSSTITTLASFNGSNGAYPNAGLVEDSSGDLFGTAANGGVDGYGTVFELQAGSSSITLLATFNGSNGAYPNAGLAEDSFGDLFGTTPVIATADDGTVFEVKAGSTTITTLASIEGPNGGLIEDNSGDLYGTTSFGGAENSGTVFELQPAYGIFSTLSFGYDINDSIDPFAGLLKDSSGNLFGTTSGGGASGDGTVFELQAGSSSITTVASFPDINNTDGPSTALIEDSNGNLFGATNNVYGSGAVFELPAGSSSITILTTFNVAESTGLVMDSGGNLFGVTSGGGTGGTGTVFELPGPTYGVNLSNGALTISQPNTGNDSLNFSLSGGVYTLTDAGGLTFGNPTGNGAGFVSGGGGSSRITIPSADVTSVSVGLGTGTNVFNLTGADAAMAPIAVNTGSAAGDQINIAGNANFSGNLSLLANTIDVGTNIYTTAGSSPGAVALTGNVDLSGSESIQYGGSLNISGGTLNLDGNKLTLTDSTATDVGSIASAISGTGGALTKGGPGTLKLLAGDSYTGPTTITGGSLLVDGSDTATSVLMVDAGATLGGTGTVGPVTVAGGTVSPGDPVTSVGNLTALSANFSNGGKLAIKVPSLSAHDTFTVLGPFALGGSSNLTINEARLTAAGAVNGIVTAGSIAATFATTTALNNANNLSPTATYTAMAVNLSIVSNGPATQLAFINPPTNSVTGEPIDASNGVQVAVEDQFGNIVNSSATVTITNTGSGSFALGSTTTAVAVNGIATFNNLVINTAGSDSLSAAASGLTSTPAAGFTVIDFVVTSLTPTPTGFTVNFSKPFLNTSTNPIHLYSAIASNANYGPADVTIVGKNTGAVTGSLIVNATNTGFTFIKTNVATSGTTTGLLAPDTYTVTFLSSPTGFQDLYGNLLDGDDNGSPGSNYVTTFTVTAPAAVVVSIPDFARGPDSTDSINIGNNTNNGIPVSLSNGSGVTTGSVTVTYNPGQLDITGAFPNPSLGNASFTLDPASTPGNAILDFTSPTPLAAGAVTLGGLIAYTPSSAAYKSTELLQITSSLNGGAIQTINDNAVQVVAYLDNVSGTGFYSGLDSGEMLNVVSGADAGFSQFPVIDPVIIGSLIGGENQVSTTDALQLNLRIATGSNQYVPKYPALPSNNPTGPDPTLSIPPVLSVSANGTVLVPVNIDDADPVGSTGMTVAQLALKYDPSEFSVTPLDVQLGSVPESGTGWTIRTVVDASTGTIGITLSSETPISSGVGGSLAIIALHVLPTASTGATAIELAESVTANGQVFSTSVNDMQGPFTLTPAPSNTSIPPVAVSSGNAEQAAPLPELALPGNSQPLALGIVPTAAITDAPVGVIEDRVENTAAALIDAVSEPTPANSMAENADIKKPKPPGGVRHAN